MKDVKIKFHNTMCVPVLMFDSKAWIMNKRDKSNFQAAEMIFLKRVKVPKE